MVFPKKSEVHLEPDEKKRIFSYIFAGILYEKGVTSDRLNDHYFGHVRAEVVHSYDVVVIRSPKEVTFGREGERWIDVSLSDGTEVVVGPTNVRAFNIMFHSRFGKTSIYAEISFAEGRPSLDTVIGISKNFEPKLTNVPLIERKRILKIPEYGRRVLLVEGLGDCIAELPEISDRGALDLAGAGGKRGTDFASVAEYLESIKFRYRL